MQTSVTWLVEFLIKCWGLYATLYRALRWNRDLCSWDSWSHLYQFNKHKKLPFCLRAICKWNWKMHSSCLFFYYLNKWLVLYDKYTQKNWEMTAYWECAELLPGLPVLCQWSPSHCTWAHSYLLRSLCSKWIEHWLKLGVYITVTINHWG